LLSGSNNTGCAEVFIDKRLRVRELYRVELFGQVDITKTRHVVRLK
jgi:hypothetical protein